MAKSNGLGRKMSKFIRLPILLFHKLTGLNIKFTSSFPIFSTTIENKKKLSIGSHTNIDKNCTFRVFGNDGSIQIGNNVCFGDNVKVLSGSLVKIEDNCTIAGNVFISSENHGLNPLTESFNDNDLECDDVVIKQGAWLGEKVIILPGVSIGEKTIVGAGSVVTKSIPDYCIAVGNPAKVIKKWDFEKKEYIKL